MRSSAGLASSNFPSGVVKKIPSRKRFEKLREADLRFVLRSHIAHPAADGRRLILFAQSLQPAIVEASLRIALQPDRDSSGPVPTFQESFQMLRCIRETRLRHKFTQMVADQILKRHSENLRQPAIGHANLPVQGNRKNRVVQAVNEFPVIQLRPGNHFHQFLELGFRLARPGVRLSRFVRGAIGHGNP